MEWRKGGRVRCVRTSVLVLGLVSALGIVDRCVAQSGDDIAPLTVRPHAMATATRTERAGEFLLDSLPEFLVYVPPQCVGASRCPLLVFLGGSGAGARYTINWQRPVADQYGFVVLGPTPANGRYFDWGTGDHANLDMALRQVLRKFAIDPDKIALVGRCGGGPNAFVWGIHNLDVFSRIVEISGNELDVDTTIPPNARAEFFVDEQYPIGEYIFRHARELRRLGHRVTSIAAVRSSHDHQIEDYAFVGHLLRDSWTRAGRAAPDASLDSLPLLTVDVLSQMTAFWTRFQQEPDSIRMTARRAHQKHVVVPVGPERMAAGMVDMPALAARYPSVTAALGAAGLSARQHDAYRVALFAAGIASRAGGAAGPIDSGSVLAKNVAFVEAHPDEIAALEATKIWDTP